MDRHVVAANDNGSSNGRTRLAHLLNVKVSYTLFISEMFESCACGEQFFFFKIFFLHSMAETKHHEIRAEHKDDTVK